MTLFYKLLYFLGIRQCGDDKFVKENEVSFYNIVKRKIFSHRKEQEMYSQPRQITRLLFERQNKKHLSPKIRRRKIPSSIQIIGRQDQVQVQVQDQDQDQNNNKLYIILHFCEDWLYSLIVFLFLCIQPMYTFISIIRTNTINEFPYYSSFFYQLIPPFHYYYCIRYFSTDHFEKFYYKNSLNGMLNLITMCIITCTLMNVSINIGRLFGTEYDGEFPFYHSLNDLSRIFIFVFLLISWIYGNFIVFLNLVCFCLIFCKHRRIIVEFSNKIHHEDCELSLNEIMQQLTFIVYDFKESIGHFQNIFSSFTFFGALSFGFFIQRIQNGNFELFPWNTFVIYLILQAIFFIMILNVSQHKNKMTDFIKNPVYINKYVKRYTINDIKQKFLDNTNDKFIVTNLIEENASLIDFMVLNQLFTDDWTEFKFFGFNIARFGLIKKGIVIVGLIIGINSILNE